MFLKHTLFRMQDKVINLTVMQPNNVGICGNTNTIFCNHAVFLTIITIDKNYKAFTNRKTDLQFPEAYNKEKYRPEKEIEKNHGSEDFYYSKISNYWCDILQNAALYEKTGIKEINLEQAQKPANQGYVVIACRNDTAFRFGSPHFATIRPDCNVTTYTTDKVKVANVGSENKVKIIKDAFGKRTCSYYYNSRQNFQKDLSYINKFN